MIFTWKKYEYMFTPTFDIFVRKKNYLSSRKFEIKLIFDFFFCERFLLFYYIQSKLFDKILLLYQLVFETVV